MISQEKVELVELLDEKMFRREPEFKLEHVRRIICGVEREILEVTVKLRPPRTVKERR